MKFKKLIITLLFSSAIFFFLYYGYTFFEKISESFSPTNTNYLIVTGDHERSVYVKRAVWGISSDHYRILLSDYPIDLSDDYSEAVFNTHQPIFLDARTKKIVIHTPRKSSQMSLPNAEQEKLSSKEQLYFLKNYKKMGLIIIE